MHLFWKFSTLVEHSASDANVVTARSWEQPGKSIMRDASLPLMAARVSDCSGFGD